MIEGLGIKQIVLLLWLACTLVAAAASLWETRQPAANDEEKPLPPLS